MRIDLDDALASIPFPRPNAIWQYAHNADVTADPDAGHAPLIRLLTTISDYVAMQEPWTDTAVVAHLITAAQNALNHPRGNLDGGRLSEWLTTLAERLELDL